MLNQLNQKEEVKYPPIYGFVTPQKHYFTMTDGTYNLNETVNVMMAPTKTGCQWDFQTELGETIKEKYEHKYIKIEEVQNVVNRQQINWICTKPEEAGAFEVTITCNSPNANGDVFPPWNTESYSELDLNASFSHFVLPKKESKPKHKYRNHWLELIVEREHREKQAEKKAEKKVEKESDWVLDL
jgi:hypothetical protein